MPEVMSKPRQRLRPLREATPITPDVRERQIVSLTYGNVKLENDRVTRPLVETAARQQTER